MISKKMTDYTFVEGSGRPYEMNPRNFEPRNDAERQQPVVIHLGDLNGQTFAKGMPKNFHTKRGRCLSSFTKYWSPDELYTEIDEAFDIE